jgi:membrane protease YdiL (CAAX protease family)
MSAAHLTLPSQHQRWMAAALITAAAAWAAGNSASTWVLLCIAPWAEEIVFRAGLQETLLQRGASSGWSNVIVALGFGATHALAWQSALGWTVAAPALLLGWVYAHQRRVTPCVLLHATMNLLVSRQA